jgi:glycine/D-amino acid oxidase-like deaminating enzyme
VKAGYDIVIVGAGIVGAACARACAAGGLKVLVLDRSCIGGGATACGMGHLVVMDDSPAQLALTNYSCRLWRQVAAEGMPASTEYDPCGTLWVAADDEEMGEVQRKKSLCDEHGVAAEVWESAQLERGEPSLRKGLAGALRVTGDGVIYPPTAAAYLLERAKASGAEVKLGVAVKRLLPEGGVELETGQRIGCKIAVNAAGPWAGGLGVTAAVKKRKGHLVITDRYPGYVHHQIVELGYLKSAHSVSADSVAFNIQPRKTGQMLIGSSRQYDAEGTEVDAAILGRMIRRAQEYLPDVHRLQAIRVWTGHRPATADKLPLIGRSVESDRIYLATGHEGLGITTSLGTGQIVADLILGKTPAIDPKPFSPARKQKEGVHG